MTSLPPLLPLSAHLSRYQFNFRDELELHDLLEQAMLEGGWIVEREVALGPKDRIDFVVHRVLDEHGRQMEKVEVGVEVKVRAPLAQVERQLRRYAAHSRLAGILLVSSSVQLARLPSEIDGKPIKVALVGTTL